MFPNIGSDFGPGGRRPFGFVVSLVMMVRSRKMAVAARASGMGAMTAIVGTANGGLLTLSRFVDEAFVKGIDALILPAFAFLSNGWRWATND